LGRRWGGGCWPRWKGEGWEGGCDRFAWVRVRFDAANRGIGQDRTCSGEVRYVFKVDDGCPGAPRACAPNSAKSSVSRSRDARARCSACFANHHFSLLSPSSKRLIPWNNDAAADWTRARPWTDPSHAIHLQLRCAAVIGELDRWQLDEPPISLSQQENSSLEALP